MNKIKNYIPMPQRREIFTVAIVAIEFIFFCLLAKNFLSLNNLSNILRNSIDLSIVAIGVTMVMLLGGVDISVGSRLGVVAILVGWMLQANWNPFLIAGLAVLIGAITGILNGALIVFGQIPDLILTLAMSNIWRAAIFGMLGGQWLTGLPAVFSVLTRNTFLGLPIPVYIIITLYIFFWCLMTFTSFGRSIYAVGNNQKAAELNGIKPNNIRIVAYGILGALVGFASLLYVGRMGSVEITVGIDLPLAAISATVIGGLSLKSGGSGSLVGTLAGVIFMAIMRNGLILLGVPSLWDRVSIGALIIISVAIDIWFATIAKRNQRMQIAYK